ncbi:MAG: DUF4976 domain-containing protein, partial [bacterium]|nr:DUF4976 domain-containing protein [bacterium]
LVPILTGEGQGDRHHDTIRCEYYDVVNRHFPDEEAHQSCWATMFRDERYKLVVYHEEDFGELYDLQDDPDEFNNLWDDSAHAGVKMRLLKQNFDNTVVSGDPGPARMGRY